MQIFQNYIRYYRIPHSYKEVKKQVNEGKTKNMLSTSRDMRRIDSQITTDNYTFDTVNEFTYLGSAVATKNDVSLEIKQNIIHVRTIEQ